MKRIAEMGPRQLANARYLLFRKWAEDFLRRLSFARPEEWQVSNLINKAYKLGRQDERRKHEM